MNKDNVVNTNSNNKEYRNRLKLNNTVQKTTVHSTDKNGSCNTNKNNGNNRNINNYRMIETKQNMIATNCFNYNDDNGNSKHYKQKPSSSTTNGSINEYNLGDRINTNK